jgi:hypothetical protein
MFCRRCCVSLFWNSRQNETKRPATTTIQYPLRRLPYEYRRRSNPKAHPGRLCHPTYIPVRYLLVNQRLSVDAQLKYLDSVLRAATIGAMTLDNSVTRHPTLYTFRQTDRGYLLWTMAPTVTAAAKSRTTTARPKKGLTAKCAENQANLDILVEKRGQLRPTDKFSFTMKRAIESLQKSKEPVTSYAEALKLSYVGPTTASMIFSDRLDEGEASAAPRPRKRKAKKPNDTTTASSNSPNASPSTKRAPESSGAPVAAKRRRHRDSLGAGEASRLLRSAIAEKPTAKEVAYTNAVSQAENYIGKKLTWRAILLVDGREKKSEHMRAKCEMSGIPSEERMLPIGDMAWIGQGIVRELYHGV